MCGGFTTFSTFAVDVIGLVETGRYTTAAKFVAVNNIGSLAAAVGAAFVLRRSGFAATSPLLHSCSHELLSSTKLPSSGKVAREHVTKTQRKYHDR